MNIGHGNLKFNFIDYVWSWHTVRAFFTVLIRWIIPILNLDTNVKLLEGDARHRPSAVSGTLPCGAFAGLLLVIADLLL